MRVLISLSFLLLLGAGSAYAKFVQLSNDYVMVGVDSDTGRFIMETVQGDTSVPYDDFKPLLYSKAPPTSMTTVSVDGEFYIFGSDDGDFRKRPYLDGKKIVSEWSVKDISVIQEISVVRGTTTGLDDTMLINYKIANKSGRKAKVGLRLLLDTALGDTEPKAFGIPGQGNVDRETQLFQDAIPAYWYCFDDYNNPVIRAQGTVQGNGAIKPDMVVFASWDRFFENKWDITIDSTRDFRRTGTTQYDSSVGLYFNPIDVDKEQQVFFSTLYGVYGTSFFTDKDMLLSLSVPIEPKAPPVPVAVDFVNQSKSSLDRLTFEFTVPRGFSLDQGMSNIVQYVKVEPNGSRKVLWNLISGSIGGNFKVKVKATGIINNNSQTIEAEKNFSINYLESQQRQTAQQSSASVVVDSKSSTPSSEVAKTTASTAAVSVSSTSAGTKMTITVITNQAVRTIPPLSAEEKRLMREISELDAWITEINNKYEVLMGIYRNIYQSRGDYLQDVDGKIKKYETYLYNQQTELSNQKKLMRD